MAEVKLFAIQRAVEPYGANVPVGKLVSGIWNERWVIALGSVDRDGQFFLVLNGPAGLAMAPDTGLSHIQEVAGTLTIEPSQGVAPYALPAASPDDDALVLNESGEIGLRLTIVSGNALGGKFVVMTNLETGQTLQSGKRILLKGFRLLLHVEGRKEPFLVGDY